MCWPVMYTAFSLLTLEAALLSRMYLPIVIPFMCCIGLQLRHQNRGSRVYLLSLYMDLPAIMIVDFWPACLLAVLNYIGVQP
jgi:hypothetical protein